MDFTTFEGAVTWVSANGYTLIFLAMLIEGPLVTAAAAFLAATGTLNIWVVCLLAIAGDQIADFFYYGIGRATHFTLIRRFGPKLGLTEKRAEKLISHLHTHAWKTIIGIKLAPFLPAPGLTLIGATGFSFKRYTIITLIATLPKVIIFMTIGYYFGHLYNTFEKYFSFGIYGIILGIASLLILPYSYAKIASFISKKFEARG